MTVDLFDTKLRQELSLKYDECQGMEKWFKVQDLINQGSGLLAKVA